MRIAVTGASSFIGRALIEELTQRGHQCIAIIRRDGEKRFRSICTEACETAELDLHEYALLGKKTGRVDVLVSLAWNGTRGSERMNADLQRKNYEYSLQGIRSVLDCGCRVVVTAGSQAEYGNPNAHISEKTIPAPNTEYGKYKLKLYEDAYELCTKRNVRLIEPRFFSLYGPGDSEKTMLVNMARKMLKNEECNLTECVQKWDFLYIQDAVEALCALIEDEASEGIFNFGSGDCRPLREFVEEMYQLIGSCSKLNYGAVSYPETGAVSVWPDISKLQNRIGWNPKVPFSEGIGAVIEAVKRTL